MLLINLFKQAGTPVTQANDNDSRTEESGETSLIVDYDDGTGNNGTGCVIM
ncbi:hypothetical protein M407DRAFT_28910 [Tulasnella calospora MUT 4182]|uniref:Uncharacterized protein n=1 Tax=Tulasnella calospora MUT 4182 TaxID=1051891 RepID=A0A0C3LJ77_9AGAM|nr:hypothetical protein M407DRAFT_28910 [Tulasnella calospora MUT 4182]